MREVRRSITSSAFIIILLVAVMGLLSLFSIWSINRAWVAGMEKTSEVQALSTDTMNAGLTFTVQVQEWKNILLRGSDPALLEKYLSAFRDRAEETGAQLAKIAAQASAMGFAVEAQRASEIKTRHGTMFATYQAALMDKIGASNVLSPDAAGAVDRQLLGADRSLNADIEAFSADIAQRAAEQRATLAAEMNERYLTLKWFIVSVIFAVIVIIGYLLFGSLRALKS